MKSFKFFGKKFIFKIENQTENSNKKIKRKISSNFRLFTIISILAVFVLFFKMDIIKKKYKINDIAKETILSPMTIEFENIAEKRKIIENIRKNFIPVYSIEPTIAEKTIEKIDILFDKLEILANNFGNIEEIKKFKENSEIVFSEEPLIRMIKSGELNIARQNIITFLNEAYKKGIREEDLEVVRKEAKELLGITEYEIVLGTIETNQFFDEEKTKNTIREKIQGIKPVKTKINIGEILVEKGEKITEEDLLKLNKTGVHNEYGSFKNFFGIAAYIMVIGLLLFFFGRKYLDKDLQKNNIYYPTILTLGAMLMVLWLTHLRLIYLYPFGALVLILGIISNERYSYIMSGSTLLMLLPYLGFDIEMLIVNGIGILVGMYYTQNIKNRTDIVNAGIAMGIAKVFAGFALSLIFKTEFITMVLISIQFLLSGILSGMITMALLPYLENTFNILTDIKLLELGDFSNPLLKDLLIKAPGTFHHSILVATLAETAAEAIGANSTFTRVAAYYHDIGKTKRPNFFVENQSQGINPHDNISPSLSTLIITSHTRDGDKIARMHKIPKEIRDVMKEHQGTTLLAYFYNKETNSGKKVNEADFRYEGPKPKTKESAVIMLADSIEAAVRSLEEKNPVVVENIIRKIISGKIEDGQLSEAELTFKDIEIVIKTFVKVIKGVYHTRIKYPDVKK